MQRLILYDGVCNLCLWCVNFVKPRGNFQFLPYQEAEHILRQYPAIPKDMSSVAFIDNGEVYLYSTAVLRISKYLSYPSKLFCVCYIVPRFIRDPIYRYIGRNRYKWFGKCECQ